MDFYFPAHAFPQRPMHHAIRQPVFYPQYDDIEVVIVEEEPRQDYRLFGEGSYHHHRCHPGFGEGLHYQRLYQQQREQQARLYRQQQREYALEQQRLREEQAALYMLYRQKEQERIRHQQEQERIRRQQEQERLRRQQEEQEQLYRRRVAEVLEERERRRQQFQQQQRALFSFLFSQEDTDMEEPQQQSEEHPQQAAQSHMEVQQEVPETEPEQEATQHQEPQEEVSHHDDSQQESDDDTSLNIRFLFSPQAQSVASDDDNMASEDDQVPVHHHDQDHDMTADEEASSESETEDPSIWERLSEDSNDEKLAETKHLQLRMLSEQLKQLDEKHSSTIPTTRLQFADDSSSEVTAISRENRQFLGLEDEVLQVMLQLDAVDSNGDESIRQERKALIRKAEQLLAKMDEHKQQEWERISVSSAASA